MSTLEKRIKSLEDKVEKLSKPKAKKKLSKYNEYMSEAVPKLKKADPEKYSGKDGHNLAFKDASAKWTARKTA